MKKRFLSCVLAILLLVSCIPPAFAVEAPAKEYGVYLTGQHILRGESFVSVMLTGEKRNGMDPDAWKREIRVFSFDTEKGVFETGKGREPGDEVKWVKWLENGYGYTVKLNRPGKYLLSGVPVYVLDPGEERQAALLKELDGALEKADANTQTLTGTNLYKWIQKRVKAKLPADQPEMAEICGDPMNALLTGFAAPEAYAPLLRMILSLAHIRTAVVDGKRLVRNEETEGTWAVCELDGQWLWTDPALDAGKTACFAKEEDVFRKDHMLSEPAELFVQKYIRSVLIDVYMQGDQETNRRLMLGNRNEGNFYEFSCIDGPLYSVGPSEPVTLRTFKNYEDDIPDDVDDEWIRYHILHNILQEKYIYDDQYHFFRRPLTTDPDFDKIEIDPEDVEILEYDRDLTRIVLRFKTPGLYYTWYAGDSFCVLDPDDPEQAEIGRLLDEARTIPKGATDRETAKSLQDWEASKLKYEYEAFKISYGLNWDTSLNASVDFTEENMDIMAASQDAFGALASGTAVCGGYANLYSLILRNAGIPAYKVSGFLSGRKVGHAWNIVRMDGTWLFADPTWDDSGNRSSTKYFAKTLEEYHKHHAGDFDRPESYVIGLFEESVYYTMCRRFDTRYGVKLDLPEMLRTLPGDVSGYDFPAKDPAFLKCKLDVSDDCIRYDFGKNKINIASSVHNMRGEQYEAYDLSDRYMFPSDRYSPFARYPKGQIIDFVAADYLGPYKPVNKPCITQEYIWARTVLEETNYSYSVPMKRNEIRGYSENSRRTWTYDMELRKKAMTWDLEKDGTTLSVTAYFDENGKTVRAGVMLTPPSGGNGFGWETTRDGHLTSLRVDDGDDTWLLAEMTDSWMQNRYEAYRRKVLRKYSSITETDPLPEGVHLYRFSKDILVTSADTMFLFRPNLYGGEAIATTDELFYWDEEGRLQANPEARDLNGEPISLEMGKAMDLSMAARLLISD